MDLFHGSGSCDPLEIACGEEGFDLRLSRGGSWGYAIYLTESAQYSDLHITLCQMMREWSLLQRP